MSAHLPRLSFAALLGLAATAGAQTTPSTAGHAGMTMPGERRDSALLTGVMGSRSPVGTVTVEGRTVHVAWAGDQPGTTRPWYVHKGSCDRDEGMVGSPSAYTPIAVDASGAGSGMATLPGPLAASDAYYVAVHAGTPGAPSGIVACGPLGSGRIRMRQMADMPGMRAGHDSAGAMNTSMSGMDPSMMNMPGMQPAGGGSGMHMRMSPSTAGGASGAMESGDAMTTMLALHRRMMADPVIRRRVMRDPTMRRMAEQTTSQTSAGGGEMPGMSMPTTPTGDREISGRLSATPKPARKSTSKPAPKRDAMPGMDMKGMGHGSMPGMGGKP